MTATIRANINIAPNVTENFAVGDLPAIGAMLMSYATFNQRKNLSATTTPPVTKVYGEQLTSSQALDLTNLTRSIGAAVVGTGLKVQLVMLVNLSTTNTVTLADGAGNAYQLQGGQSALIQPGGIFLEFYNDKLADVDATHKNLAITATGGQSYQLLILLG
jgi:hypothetical protein